MGKIKIFISYGHTDATTFIPSSLKTEFEKLVEKFGLDIKLVFDESFIKSGSYWNQEIIEQLESSNVVLCLLNEKFHNSNYINTTEMPLILDSIIKKGIHVAYAKLFNCSDIISLSDLKIESFNKNKPYFDIEESNYNANQNDLLVIKNIANALFVFIIDRFNLIPPSIAADKYTTEDKLISQINRQEQFDRFSFGLESLSDTKIQYYYYLFNKYDFAHLFNFRIVNIELKEKQLERRNRFAIMANELKTSKIKYTILNLSKNLFNNKGASSIDAFIENFNNSDRKKILIPIIINHSIDTKEENLFEINQFLKLFADNKAKLLSNKKIFFFLAIQTENKIYELENIKILLEGLEIIEESNLLTLENVTISDINKWLLDNIDSSAKNAERMLNSYFIEAKESNSMDDVYSMADKLIKNLNIIQNDSENI